MGSKLLSDSPHRRRHTEKKSYKDANIGEVVQWVMGQQHLLVLALLSLTHVAAFLSSPPHSWQLIPLTDRPPASFLQSAQNFKLYLFLAKKSPPRRLATNHYSIDPLRTARLIQHNHKLRCHDSDMETLLPLLQDDHLPSFNITWSRANFG